MNFYNPYYIPYNVARGGLFSNLFKGFSFSSLLSGTGKFLNVVNQAIPVFKEIRPMIKNTKTMFRVMNEFKKEDTPNVKQIAKETTQYNNGPTFFN